MATFRTSQVVSAVDTSIPHLVLVGLPGAGKSSVGRAVATELRRNFLDVDAEIERREGATIAEIFGARGEGYFRSLERGVSEELAGTGGFVVATGGGWASNPGCLEAVRASAQVVYLQVDPARALKRMAAASAQRPLLRHPDPLAELKRLLVEREGRYLLADHVVRVDFVTEKEVVASLVALARRG